MDTTLPRLRLNGAPPTVGDLEPLLRVNYGHFTSMQVRDKAVRGLALHLQRLDASTRELFGCALPTTRVREELRAALQGLDGAFTARVSVHARGYGLRNAEPPATPDVLISISAPAPVAAAPLRVTSLRYGRDWPRIKHIGTFGLYQARRLARARDCDDALFVGDDDEISEGSIWNVGFYDGERVIWPSAPALPGVTQQLLQAALQARGMPTATRPLKLADLTHSRCAFFCNASVPVQPIARIDAHEFAFDTAFYRMLNEAYDALPWDAI